MLNSKLNQLGPSFFEQANALLDQVEATKGPGILVVINSGKIFSAGLDLKHIKKEMPKNLALSFGALQILIARIMKLPLPSLAVLNGHTIAGGLMLAMGFDKIIMVNDPQVKIGLTEIDAGVGFPYALMRHVKLRNNRAVSARLIAGHIMTPQEAFIDRVVHDLYKGEDEMIGKIHRFARQHAQKATDREGMRFFYSDLYHEECQVLLEPQLFNLMRSFPKL